MSVKSDVIRFLEENRGRAVSGQQLAESLGVSRAAVWKAVKALEAEGYAVEATRNKGYRLAPQADEISAEGVRVYLPASWRDYPVEVTAETESTNLLARRYFLGGQPPIALVAANAQTGGRGRLGKAFYSPAGAGVYMSLAIRANAPLDGFLPVTVAAAVAVVRVVERHSDAKPSIKWVNDVYIGDKKVCGILTEAVSDFESGMLEAAVVGVGLNVRKTDLPEALAGVAGYVPGLTVSRNQLIAEIALEIAGLAENLRDPALMEEYRAHSLVLGRKVRWQQDGEWYTGRAAAIDDRGGLLIETGGGTVRLAAGEVSVLPEPLA